MNDRELLELAAKAAGMDLLGYLPFNHNYGTGPLLATGVYWNPLTDDGDALRLAVKLGICFGPNFDNDRAVCFGENGNNICELFDTDPYAATRRAIVRAAAAIGAAMQQTEVK